MRWTKKQKKEPRLGDIRVKKKFLFFPKCLDGQYRWLETARVIQEYGQELKITDFGNAVPEEVWQDIHWQDSAPITKQAM